MGQQHAGEGEGAGEVETLEAARQWRDGDGLGLREPMVLQIRAALVAAC
jgi:hypothetical protein